MRGDSTHSRGRIESVASELLEGTLRVEPGQSKLIETRRQVERGWRAAAGMLIAQGDQELAANIRRFVAQMPPATTEKELLAAELQVRLRSPPSADRTAVR
jgi:hypothetical protein